MLCLRLYLVVHALGVLYGGAFDIYLNVCMVCCICVYIWLCMGCRLYLVVRFMSLKMYEWCVASAFIFGGAWVAGYIWWCM